MRGEIVSVDIAVSTVSFNSFLKEISTGWVLRENEYLRSIYFCDFTNVEHLDVENTRMGRKVLGFGSGRDEDVNK